MKTAMAAAVQQLCVAHVLLCGALFSIAHVLTGCGGGGKTNDFLQPPPRCENNATWADPYGNGCRVYNFMCSDGQFCASTSGGYLPPESPECQERLQSRNYPNLHCCNCGKAKAGPTPAPTPSRGSPSTPSRDKVSREELMLFELVNEVRKAGYTCPDGTQYSATRELAFDCRVWRAVQLHSQEMADYNLEPSHSSPDGTQPRERLQAQGMHGGDCAGEAVHHPNKDPQTALDALMSSNDHCKKLMKTKNLWSGYVEFLAAGSATGVSGTYWTLMIATNKYTTGVDDKSCL